MPAKKHGVPEVFIKALEAMIARMRVAEVVSSACYGEVENDDGTQRTTFALALCVGDASRGFYDYVMRAGEVVNEVTNMPLHTEN